MPVLHRFIVTFCLLLVGVASAADAPRSVLFVGNSFSFYNNGLHNHYKQLVASGQGTVRTRLLSISGGYLREHVPMLPALAASEDWDVIVLQGYSTEPIDEDKAGAFRDAAKALAGIARTNGARPVFFVTWAYVGRPAMTGMLDEAYSGVGQELAAQVVPVGPAFARAVKEKPKLALRMADGKHPTLAGTYLAACVFFAALQGETPQELPYTAGIARDDAMFLQSIAWQTVEEYAAR